MSFFPRRKSKAVKSLDRDNCVVVSSPGGLDALDVAPLRDRITVGYNIPHVPPPFATEANMGSTHVIVDVDYFSVNFADIAIRWGLYESALKFVGWPIVPGFDFAGHVRRAGSASGFAAGDAVYGFSLFGAYSRRLLVPCNQLRRVPSLRATGRPLALDAAAGLPAVAATALHAIALAGGWPQPLVSRCRAALVHSAAGGVGSMLIQMCRLRGYSPVVAVVGSAHKVAAARALGADIVIDKSAAGLWRAAEAASPGGYAAIFDANGAETLQASYDHLAATGHLVCYGFHSNVPKGSAWLSPSAWASMALQLWRLPRFDPMHLVTSSRSVSGFNLSFFADESELILRYFDQIEKWVVAGDISAPSVTVFDGMLAISAAQEAIQTGKSVGKIVVRV